MLISNVVGDVGVEDYIFFVCVSWGVDVMDMVEFLVVVYMVCDFLELFGEFLRKRECGRVCMVMGKV